MTSSALPQSRLVHIFLPSDREETFNVPATCITFRDVLARLQVQHGRVEGWKMADAFAAKKLSDAQLDNPLPADCNDVCAFHPDVCLKASRVRMGHATPHPDSGTQEMDALGDEMASIEELIDNPIAATFDCAEPCVNVDLIQPGDLLPLGEKAKEYILLIEDGGCGMSKETLGNLLRAAVTTAQAPVVKRDAKPLPLQRYINRKLNRWGRGCQALHSFGDRVCVRTKERNSNVVHELVSSAVEWRSAFASNSGSQYPISLRETVDDAMLKDPTALAAGFTIIQISLLKPERLRQLQDPAVIRAWRRRAHQDYALFIHGFPGFVYDNMPPAMRPRGVDKPPTNLRLMFFKELISHQVFEDLDAALLAARGDKSQLKASMLQRYQEMPDLVRVLLAAKQQHVRHSGLRLLVHATRYVPFGLELDSGILPTTAASAASGQLATPAPLAGIPPGKVPRTSLAAAPSSSAASAATALTQRYPGAAAGAGKKAPASSPAVGSKRRAPAMAASSGEAGPSVSRAVPIAVNPVGSSALVRESKVVDFCLITFNFPFELSHRTKPMGVVSTDDGQEHELFVFPIWSGRLMTHNDALKRYPSVLQHAADIVKQASQEHQVHAYKLGEKCHERLVCLLLISPDCFSSHHKTNISDPAFEAFMLMGAKKATMLCSGQAVPRGLRRGCMHTFDWESEQFVVDELNGTAAQQTAAHFIQNWKHLDEDGVLRMMSDGGDGAFVLVNDGSGKMVMVARGTMFYFGSKQNEPVERGETVRLFDPGAHVASNSQDAGRQKSRYAKQYLRVEHFTHGMNSHEASVLAWPWRPSWSDTSGLASITKQIMHVQPMRGSTKAQRRDSFNKDLRDRFESNAPSHLVFDPAAPLQPIYTASNGLVGIGVCVGSGRPKDKTIVEAHKLKLHFDILLEDIEIDAVLYRLEGDAGGASTSAALTGAGGRTLLWSGRQHVQRVEARADFWDLQEHLGVGGSYLFEACPKNSGCHMFPKDLPPLSHAFTVQAGEPAVMEACWECPAGTPSDQLHELCLGEPSKRRLLVRLLDQVGIAVPFPVSGADLRSRLQLELVYADGQTFRRPTLQVTKPTLQQLAFQGDATQKVLAVPGLTAPPQCLEGGSGLVSGALCRHQPVLSTVLQSPLRIAVPAL